MPGSASSDVSGAGDGEGHALADRQAPGSGGAFGKRTSGRRLWLETHAGEDVIDGGAAFPFVFIAAP